jgi:hypothetical protein
MINTKDRVEFLLTQILPASPLKMAWQTVKINLLMRETHKLIFFSLQSEHYSLKKKKITILDCIFLATFSSFRPCLKIRDLPEILREPP